MTQPRAGTGGASTYADTMREAWADSRIWDYLRYDEDGHLWLNGLRVIDAVRAYGSPLEIVDTTIVERRCREWRDLSRGVAQQVGYRGRLDYLYAAKANMASEVVHAAYRSGWGAETSARQDLDHLRWLRGHGLLPEDLRVVCNGFKLPPACYARPKQPGAADPPHGTVELPGDTLTREMRRTTYAEAIIDMARDGWDVTPILDAGELETFLAPDTPEMDVGLRMKMGRVASLEALDGLVSRFGLTRSQLAEAADAVDAAEHLRLTTLHAMVGAAETIPVERFVDALLLAGRVWAWLRQEHPTLVELNMGGGVPPLSEPYDHRAFLESLLTGLTRLSAEAGVPPPNLTFELGSLVAAEGGVHVFRVLQTKRNHAAPGGVDTWAIVDGGLMAAIPDMLLLDKPFRIFAVEGAHAPARSVRLGDPSCDSDGRYPPKAFGEDAALLLPKTSGPQHVLIQGVGAYQEILSGVRGAHHCGLLEAVELIIEPGAGNAPAARLMPRQTPGEAAALLGYTDASVAALRAALAATQPAAQGAGGPS